MTDAPRCRFATRAVPHRLACALVLAGAVLARAGDAAGEATSCVLEHELRLDVADVIDGETFRTRDGRTVRLVGAMAPQPPGGETAETWLPARDARQALADVVADRSVELAFAGRREDRRGRLLAQVFVGEAEPAIWVQGQMLAGGHARAYALPGSVACLPEMLAAEEAARRERHGLWALAAFAPRAAQQTGELMRQRSDFVLVEGRVTASARRSDRLYIDFGADWRRDFTIVVPPRVLREAPEAAQTLSDLTGRRLRVRGWIERRNGPAIEISDPREIELLPEPATAN